MEWMFVIFILGVIGYTITIAREYRQAALQISDQLRRMDAEKMILEGKALECEEERSRISAQVEEVKQAVRKLQATADKRKTEIKQLEKHMERRGKYRL